jgi:hypothetical protein
MKRKALALTFITLLFVSVLDVALVAKMARANFFHATHPMPYIEVLSPQPQAYDQSTVVLDTVTYCDKFNEDDEGVLHFETLKWLVFNLDGEVQPLEWVLMDEPGGLNISPFTSVAKANLTDLSDGVHSLMVYGETTFDSLIFANVTFAVYTKPMQIDFFSLENKTYSSTSIALDFAVDRLTSWMGFSLNNQSNMTIYGNMTLTDLPLGSHSLVVYANDTYGNMGTSETIHFTIAELPEPFPTSLVATASVIIVFVVFAVFLFYRRKHKQKSLVKKL